MKPYAPGVCFVLIVSASALCWLMLYFVYRLTRAALS